MKLHEWISPRNMAIIGIVVVLIAIGFHIYMQQDIRQFEAHLPKTPTAQSSQLGGSSISVPLTEETSPGPAKASITEESAQITPVSTAELVEVSQNDEAAAGCNMSGGMMIASEDDGKDEPTLYAGLTEEEVQQLIKELSSFSVTDLDEKLGMLENVLISKFGPDPEIPHLIGNLNTAYTLIEMGKNANAVQGDNTNEVNDFLNQLPVVVVSDMVETAINLFDLSEEEAAVGRAHVDALRSKIDGLELLQDVKPMVIEGISAGDITPEEAEAFLENLSGLDVTVSEPDRTQRTKELEKPTTLDGTEPIVPKIPDHGDF
ncbi:MAG: hypothetical protein OXH00_05430 [Candidatus Poribacteria bacterium]|nr:hypothetical protein [Candidatus Poribacteria bacterium]